MSTETNKEIARKWFAFFNAHDLENLLSLYSDDAKHYSPKLKVREPSTGGYIKGKDQLRAWWKDAFERLDTLKYEPQKFTADEQQVFMEYKRYVTGEETLMVGEVLEIRDGLIVFSRVYHG